MGSTGYIESNKMKNLGGYQTQTRLYRMAVGEKQQNYEPNESIQQLIREKVSSKHF
jgi:hypothetical protein